MIEPILRRIFHAPTIVTIFDENNQLPARSVTLPELEMNIIGCEPGDHVYIGSDTATVYPGDDPTASTDVIGKLGHGPHMVRRRILSRLLRHFVGAGWTLAGMLIVLLTLTGTAQVVSLAICLVFFAVDLMSISIRRR